ncbi:MAG TPA: hypothetical protein PLH57_10530, partial [Oligoflexia bacterium]|nr:hypothetical protein [Oligoflexia bacterium]
GAIVRRLQWLRRIAEVYQNSGDPELLVSLARTEKLFASTLDRAEKVSGLGIRKPYPLTELLDDTPVESFLARFYDELCAFEAHLFDLLHAHHQRVGETEAQIRIEECINICALWGREIAGEKLLIPNDERYDSYSVFEGLYQFLEGGDLQWKPLLPRRLTENEVHYELRFCPHARGHSVSSNAEAKTLACRFESVVFEHFAKFLAHNATFSRTRGLDHCTDRIFLNN